MKTRIDIDPKAVGEEAATTALIILGAGLSLRFGEADKLGESLKGIPLAQHILNTISGLGFAQKILVCSSPSSWQAAYQAAGLTIVRNGDPSLGIASSLNLGASAVTSAQKVLICLADMPLIERCHVERLLDASASGLSSIIATRSADYMGPPAILPLQELLALPVTGEGGARGLIGGGAFIETGLAGTHDVDVAADLLLAAELMSVSRD